MKPTEICCHWLEARLVDDCSGGNSRPLHPSGVGGGHFLIKKSDHRYIAALRDRPTVRFLTMLSATGAVESRDLRRKAALGIFFRFQVRDFNLFHGFFSLRHFYFPFSLVCVFSVTPKST